MKEMRATGILMGNMNKFHSKRYKELCEEDGLIVSFYGVGSKVERSRGHKFD